MPVFRSLAALCVTLARAGLQECVGFFRACVILGGGGWTIGDGHEVKIGLPGTLVDVREYVGGLDPAFGFLEIRGLAIEPGEVIGIIAEVTVIDGDFRSRPLIAACHRKILRRCRRCEQHRCRAERSQSHLMHDIVPLCRKPERFRSMRNGVAP
jgi:hypothetical protein